ncbi:MAG: hypothetical protein INR71_01835 [Terriglobus roseus]|nr:hypothetical protein [Terriglobus roseus]
MPPALANSVVLLQQITAGLKPGVVIRPRILNSPQDSPLSADFSTEIGCADATDPMSTCLGDIWQADLAQGAVESTLTDDGADVTGGLGGAQFSMNLPNGTTVDVPASQGDVSFPTFAEDSESDGQIKSEVTDTLLSAGLLNPTVQVFRPLDAAVSIQATVPDDLNNLTLSNIVALVNPGRDQFCGVYLELDSPTGTVLARSATSELSGAGRLWVNPQSPLIVGGFQHG